MTKRKRSRAMTRIIAAAMIVTLLSGMTMMSSPLTAFAEGGVNNTNLNSSNTINTTYTVKWMDENGTVLEIDEIVEDTDGTQAENTYAQYNGETPTKATDSTAYTYQFMGWKCSGLSPDLGIDEEEAVLSDYAIMFLTSNKSYWVGDTLTLTAVYATVKPFQVGGVYAVANGWNTIGSDWIDFGETTYLADSTYESGLTYGNGVSRFINENGYRADSPNYAFGIFNEHGGAFLHTDSEDLGENIAVKVTDGTGTKNDPYTVELVKYNTVTWVDADGNPILSEIFETGTAPVYHGMATSAKASADENHAFVLTGWTDGTKTYGLNDTLPALTTDMTYTATFEEVECKPVAKNIAYYVGDKINFGDSTPVMDYTGKYGYEEKTYDLSGVYTLVSLTYSSSVGYTVKLQNSSGETVEFISYSWRELGDDIAIVLDTPKNGYNRFYTHNCYTITWQDEDGNVLEVDERVPSGFSPSYDGSALTKESDSDEYTYSLYWRRVYDSGNVYDFRPDVLGYVSNNVTYTAVFKKSYPAKAGNIYFADDVIDFGDGAYIDGGKYNGVNGELLTGEYAFERHSYNTSNSVQEFVLRIIGSNGYYIGIPCDTQYPNDVELGVKIASGDGTKENPYICEVVPAYTVTWQDEDGTVLETDTKLLKDTKPSYDGKTPEKENTQQYNYTFKGWTNDGGETVYTADKLPNVTENVTYTAVFDVELITYPFSIDKSAGGVTLEIADHEGKTVAIDNNSFSAPIGSKITSSAELVFDGAEVTAETSENSYVYTIKSVSKDSVTVSRQKVDIAELTVTADNQTYTGSALTPVIVKDGEAVLTENTDYTVVYTDNVNAGTATAKITGADTYVTGETTVNFTIAKKNIASLDVEFDLDGDGTEYAPETYTTDSNKPSIIYDGKEYTPTAKLIFNNAEVPSDSYDVSMQPTPGKAAGTYTFTFTAKENTNFTGTRTFEWNINKAEMNIGITDGLSFNRVGKAVAGECVDESLFNVTGVPEGSTIKYTYFSEYGLLLPQKPTEAGKYTVMATVSNDNYNDGTATAHFTIISNQAGDYYFSKTANNTILITGYAGTDRNSVIPETINGYPVKGIYYYAFEDSDITSVTIPESVGMIYSYAFKNAKELKDVYYEGSKTQWKKEVTVSSGNNLLTNATIHYALPESIYLDQTTFETTVGKSVRLLVSVMPVGTAADFTWTSSDETVAAVDENGNVTTLGFGTATITATADNGKTAVCEVTVGHNGSNGIFEYTVSDEKEITVTKYIGTSDTVDVSDKIDNMPVIVISNGTFSDTPVKTINYSGSKAMWQALFAEELENVTINYALPTSIALNKTADVTKARTITLTPTVTPADITTSFTWASSDESIAAVDENGTVTGVAYGTVTITATADNGQKATCQVTVVNEGVLDEFEYEILEDDTVKITKYNGSAKEVQIPENITDMPVTEIGENAFKDNAALKDVIILLNVQTIGEDAFAGCTDLTIYGYRRTDSERYAEENNVNFVAIPYPLENACTISSKHTNVNESVTLTGVGIEGTLEYTYAVYYKLKDAEKWTVKQNYSENNVVELALKQEGTYNVCMKVKDTDGNISKRYFVLYVTQPLTNNSTISTDTLTVRATA